MKIISFDVGIKNMAYCCLLLSENNVEIIDWQIINLMNTETPSSILCNCVMPTKSKKQAPKICNKKAKYSKDNAYFCEKHAKTCKYILPTNENKLSFLKKQKIDTLMQLCNQHFLYFQNKPKKEDIVNKLETFYKNKCLEKINIPKRSASQVDLVEIGKNMKYHFNNRTCFQDVTHVIIENQISPIANRMKTIQGMLAQYFIMKNDTIVIEFVSSSNKLKQFITSSSEDKNSYKKNKKDGVFYTQEIVDNNVIYTDWKETLRVSKKDDLADCFLQGLWYFKHNNIISYADNLKINIV
tara:strand:- start:6643 stop:7533 length:891 start_codon:yes stop_codon:yes gene_type:complete